MGKSEGVSVTTTLAAVHAEKIGGAQSLWIDLFNTGATALNAFEIWLYANADSPGVRWFSQGSEWTSPASGSPLKGSSAATDPTTLAGGASVGFRIADSDGALRGATKIEFRASVASGTTTVSIYVGRSDG